MIHCTCSLLTNFLEFDFVILQNCLETQFSRKWLVIVIVSFKSFWVKMNIIEKNNELHEAAILKICFFNFLWSKFSRLGCYKWAFLIKICLSLLLLPLLSSYTFSVFIFSRTTRLITNKLGTKHPWEKGFQVFANKGSGTCPL